MMRSPVSHRTHNQLRQLCQVFVLLAVWLTASSQSFAQSGRGVYTGPGFSHLFTTPRASECDITGGVNGNGAEGVIVEDTTTVDLPKGTTGFRLRVEGFSAEYPQYTGDSSQFNDQITVDVQVEGQTVYSGSWNVNTLHNQFDPDTGIVELTDQLVSTIVQTQSVAASLSIHATALNVGDGGFPSGMTVSIEFGDQVSLSGIAVTDVERSRTHTERYKLPPAKNWVLAPIDKIHHFAPGE